MDFMQYIFVFVLLSLFESLALGLSKLDHGLAQLHSLNQDYSSCLSIRLGNVPIKLNKTSHGEYYLNTIVDDYLRLITSESCDREIKCVIFKNGYYLNRLKTDSNDPHTIIVEKGQNYVNCRRFSKDYLKFNLFVQEKNSFFTTTEIVNRNDSSFLLKCLGGYYSENVHLRDSEKRIDVPYDPLNGFLMDSKKFSNRTFYQCEHDKEKISFSHYSNQNTYKNDVQFKMLVIPFTIKYEIQCITEGEIPDDAKMKTILVCPNTSECPELTIRQNSKSKMVYTASLSKNLDVYSKEYSCVFIRNGEVEAIAYYSGEDFPVTSTLKFLFGFGIIVLVIALIAYKVTSWNYVLLPAFKKFNEHNLSLSEKEKIAEGNSSKIYKTKYVKSGKPVIIKYSQYAWQCKKEMKMLEVLHHENIITTYGTAKCTQNNGFFSSKMRNLVLVYYEKTSLENYMGKFYPGCPSEDPDVFLGKDDLEQNLTISIFDMISFGWQIARALQYLKEAGITHRDVAMRNVLITNELYCKLSDFERAEKGESQDGNFGTNLFKFFMVKLRNRQNKDIPSMYPEECKKGAYYYETEVYCFGLLLLEMFSFMKPLEPVKQSNPKQPHYCPNNINDLIHECLKSNRKERISINDCVVKLSTIAETKNKSKFMNLKVGLSKEKTRDFLTELESNYDPPPSFLFLNRISA